MFQGTLIKNYYHRKEVISNSIIFLSRDLYSCKFDSIVLQRKKKEKERKVSRRNTEIVEIRKFDSISIVFVTVSRVRSPAVPWRPYVPCIFLLSACAFSFIIHAKLAMNHLLRRSAQVQIYRCLFVRPLRCVSHALLIVTRGQITRRLRFQPLSGRGNVSG